MTFLVMPYPRLTRVEHSTKLAFMSSSSSFLPSLLIKYHSP
jgi:hypothetical protein